MFKLPYYNILKDKIGINNACYSYLKVSQYLTGLPPLLTDRLFFSADRMSKRRIPLVLIPLYGIHRLSFVQSQIKLMLQIKKLKRRRKVRHLWSCSPNPSNLSSIKTSKSESLMSTRQAASTSDSPILTLSFKGKQERERLVES